MGGDDLRRSADRQAADLVAWRRELHRIPELAFEERETAAFVEARLRDLGLEVRAGLAITGLAGILRAESPRGPAVLLRADMDGLPIQEVEGREYGSRIPGRMHACGHDGHMAMLLGAARLLVDRRERLSRDVVFCFQPAEEAKGGAARMIREGVLDLVETGSVYALHLWSQFDSGTAHLAAGPVMAAQDEFTARVIGRGGHGALPHTTRDPILAAAHGLVALQTLVSREIDPNQAAVVSVGEFHGGTAPNVVPDEVRLEGTLRSFDDEVRRRLRRRVEEMLRSSAEAAECGLRFRLRPGFPAVNNDALAVQRIRGPAEQVFGKPNVLEMVPMATAEDFAYFLEQRPGAFVMIGAGNEKKGITTPHHSARFDIDEAVLPRGAELLARIALGESSG